MSASVIQDTSEIHVTTVPKDSLGQNDIHAKETQLTAVFVGSMGYVMTESMEMGSDSVKTLNLNHPFTVSPHQENP